MHGYHHIVLIFSSLACPQLGSPILTPASDHEKGPAMGMSLAWSDNVIAAYEVATYESIESECSYGCRFVYM